MVSFHEFQHICHDIGILNDEEFLLLYKEFGPKNPDFVHTDFQRFDPDVMNDTECFTEFRVRKRDLHLLCDVLQVPDRFTCYQRSASSGLEGLCILLKQLA